MFDVIIVGGGAAGFYSAIHIAEARPDLKIAILEQGKQVLGKVKVSGGGRCNVTHATFDPKNLIKNYPRGEKELLGPFYTYASTEVVSFFEKRGVSLKVEADGRMFPTSDSSQTIIDCFLDEADRLGISILRHSKVTEIRPENLEDGDKIWNVVSIRGAYRCRRLEVATGSSTKIWQLLEKLGHVIVKPVPSLFTFNCNDKRITGIQGISVKARVDLFDTKRPNSKVTVALKSKKTELPLLTEEGPVLITHWGLSGPAILRLSAWGARLLNEKDYRFRVRINWLPDYHFEGIMKLLLQVKTVEAKKTVLRTKAVNLPRRLWSSLVKASGIDETERWAHISKFKLENLARELTQCELDIDGKSTFKEEFVTAGGVDLKEINFKTFESKKQSQLFFAGEVMNIDAITGGFNFQSAWTGGYIAAQGIINSL
ncbi:BaiN/RdsA family NAD(P)/FAD-dependent oxidoreductase [Pareuzebyella sediminis]|uniref:NAD(P)/FAD-dependent oxidoreductase n=1 Tax=Pareuzebyella sediminis TaxID=2607998 RepID=UPI0011EE527B|nr:NAD(P)/FAD-dependent oxidoreductase [Pareuzebyella sediminis]